MTHPYINLLDEQSISGTRMLLAFSGWMDGGDVSTGTVLRLVQALEAKPFAEVDPEGFYLYNFPGAMDVSALFRPNVEVVEGRVRDFETPSNTFYASPEHKLIFFVGKEPNMNWAEFAEGLFYVAERTGVGSIVFVGSFGGSVPHTREPRLYATASDPRLLQMVKPFGVKPSNYAGPASFATYILTQAESRDIEMLSLVAEIPGYLQGTNPISIEAVTKRLARILDLPLDTEELREVSTEWEMRVSDEVDKNEDLAEQVRELEEAYDDELIEEDTES